MTKEDTTRLEIIEAAERLFHKWGINKTTMEDIARETGKGKCTVYHYFPSRQEMQRAVAEAKVMRIRARAAAEMDAKDSPREKLSLFLTITGHAVRTDWTLHELMRGQVRANKEHVAELIKKFDGMDAEILGPVLQAGMERHEFKSITPENLGTAIRAIIAIKKSLAISMYINEDDKPLLDFVANLMLAGL